MNLKFPLLTLILFTLIASINAQSYQEHRGNIYFDRFNYSKAIELYSEVLANEPDNHFMMQKLAECNKYLGIDTASVRYYEMFFKTEKNSNNDLFNYAMVLKNIGDYKKSNELLKQYNTFLKTNNYLLSEEMANQLSKKSLMYKIALVEASSPEADFSPAYFGDKVIFVSSRQGESFLHAEYERDGQPFLQLYVADKEDNGQLTNIVPFDNKFNSRVHEGPVCFCSADSTMYFTRNNFKIIKGKSFDDQVNLKIYESKFTYNQWLKGLGDKLDSIGINTKMNDEDWRRIKEFRLNNENHSTGHPSLSKDGRKMYFVSDQHDGKGGTDIYVTTRIGPNEWSLPTNLSEINTAGNEMFPFIHESGVLFFASDGLPGIGGLDIFKATPEGNKFVNPTNLRAPINSPGDDFGLIADAQTKTGYFSSDRDGGKGSDDLYTIKFIDRPEMILAGIVSDSHNHEPIPNAIVQIACEKTGDNFSVKTDEKGHYSFNVFLPDAYKLTCNMENYTGKTADLLPQNMSIINDTIPYPIELSMYGIYGYVFVKGTDKRIPGVDLTITNKANNEKTIITTNENGEFKQTLDPDTDYSLFFDKAQYFIIKDQYSTSKEKAGWVNLNESTELAMNKIEVGKTIEIPNIYYDVAKWDIRTDAAIELDKVVEFMADNPTIKIELGSHTDARGGFKTNQRLSQKRAESAVNYIVENGIEQTRIRAKGYGETKIKNRCKDGVKCSEKEHEQNRRTEIKIISILADLN